MYITICEIDSRSKFDAWNRVLKASALGQPKGMGWGGVGGVSGWGTHVHQWLIYVNVWQKPSQYCKVISLQLKFLIKKKKKCAWGLAVLSSKWLHKCFITEVNKYIMRRRFPSWSSQQTMVTTNPISASRGNSVPDS